MLDFNRDNLAATPISIAINAEIERVSASWRITSLKGST
jgi:hypothetical protein